MSYYNFANATETFDAASRYLSNGRNKKDRPLYYSGLRLRTTTNPNQLAIYHSWYRVDIGYINQDDTRIIQAPSTMGWRGNTFSTLRLYNVRRLVAAFGRLDNVFQKDYKVYIVERDPDLTPPKIRKCRMCFGKGKQDGWCQTRRCWGHDGCDPSTIIPFMGNPDSHHWQPLRDDCYRCKGAGTYDYGSNPKTSEWDGFPLKVFDGKIVRRKPTLLEMSIANDVHTIS
jgi:hypothetical protein